MILVWSGAEVTWLPAPHGTTLGLTSDQQIAVTILVVVITINAVNFIDGLDGLAAGIVGIGAAAFFAYYFTLTHRLGLPDQAGPALASAVLAGICLGFLPHNYHPARIFMGDTGAMLIGLLLAYAPISSLASLDPGSLTNYASGTAINRFADARAPAAAGRDHAHPLCGPAHGGDPPGPEGHVAVRARPQAPASPHARHRPLAPDQRPDHVSVGGPFRRQRGMAVDRPDPSDRAGHRHRGRDAGAAVRVDATAAPVGAGRRPARHRAGCRRRGRRAVGNGIAHRGPRPPPRARAARPTRGARTGADGPAAQSPARTDRRSTPARTTARRGGRTARRLRRPRPPARPALRSRPQPHLPGPPDPRAGCPPRRPRRRRRCTAAARDAAPGTGSPEGAQLASWPGGPQEPTPPWPSTPQEAPPRPPAPPETRRRGRSPGVSALAVRARGVPSPEASWPLRRQAAPCAVAASPVVLLTVAAHFAAAVPVAARWATGVLPAVAARPAGPVHAAQAVTAARPA